jgi:hypothetical protein
MRNARSLGERLSSAVRRPPAVFLSKDFFPEDVDFELLNLLDSLKRTWQISN